MGGFADLRKIESLHGWPGASDRGPALLDGVERGSLTRRRLLGLAALAAATQLPVLDSPLRSAHAGPAGSPLKRSSYAGHVGDRFTLHGPAGTSLATRLVEIRDLGRHGGSVRAADDGAFALLFHGPRSPRLEQGMYELRHPKLISASLLVVPAGTGRRGQDYEVVINQSRARRG